VQPVMSNTFRLPPRPIGRIDIDIEKRHRVRADAKMLSAMISS